MLSSSTFYVGAVSTFATTSPKAAFLAQRLGSRKTIALLYVRENAAAPNGLRKTVGPARDVSASPIRKQGFMQNQSRPKPKLLRVQNQRVRKLLRLKTLNVNAKTKHVYMP